MNVSEYQLRKWRRAALVLGKAPVSRDPKVSSLITAVLKLTQELLDYHLVRKGE